jgi:hypothetical protein
MGARPLFSDCVEGSPALRKTSRIACAKTKQASLARRPGSFRNHLHDRNAAITLPLMERLKKFIRTHRMMTALDQRLRLAGRFICLMEADPRFIVFRAVLPPAADAFREFLPAIATRKGKFAGLGRPVMEVAGKRPAHLKAGRSGHLRSLFPERLALN